MINTATLTDITGRCIAVVMLGQRTPIIAITEDADGEQYMGAYRTEDEVPDAHHVIIFRSHVSIHVDGTHDTLYLMESTL